MAAGRGRAPRVWWEERPVRPAPSDDLLASARHIANAIGEPDNALQRELLERLEAQAARLRDGAFQLAVLGQFKRGKSTLLNALIGAPLLSAGVLPLTAVPTFLSDAPHLSVRLSHLSGTVDEKPAASLDDLARDVADVTTEEHNPRNEKAIARVDVGIPAAPWLKGVTLIDTPGIGSTQAHNTEAAYGVLPECDAALFVSSVDPPITEVEIAYLTRICESVPRVVVVLNKIDLAEGDDRDTMIAFTTSVIAERAPPQVEREIFPVSARAALRARIARDASALTASGLAGLEDHVRTRLVERKQEVLRVSVRAKMLDLAKALAADAAMTATALSLPLVELDRKTEAFDAAALDFERERTVLEDALNGEWRRAIQRLGVLCDEVDRHVRERLEPILARASEAGGEDRAGTIVTEAMTEVFEGEFGRLVAAVEAELVTAIEVQERRYEALVADVRQLAGSLLDVAVPKVASGARLHLGRKPYWLGELRIETMTSLTVDGLARLLPAAWRRERRARQLRESAMRALARNISDLQWSMKQNIDDSFRRLLASSRAAVETSIAVTRNLLATTRARRRDEDASLQVELDRARERQALLGELSRSLSGS